MLVDTKKFPKKALAEPKVKPLVPEGGWTELPVVEAGFPFPEGDNSTVEMIKDVAECGAAFTSSTFYYGEITDPALKQELEDAANAIDRHLSMMKKRAVEIGRILRSLKGKLPHGMFGRWLLLNFAMSHRTAQNFMIAADLCDKCEKFSLLPTAAIYLLGAPNTPEWVVNVLAGKIKEGEPVPSVAEVRKSIVTAKAIEAASPGKSPAAKAAALAVVEPAKITEAKPTLPGQSAHDSAVKAAVALLVENLPESTLVTFTGHCEAAGWHEQADALKEAL